MLVVHSDVSRDLLDFVPLLLELGSCLTVVLDLEYLVTRNYLCFFVNNHVWSVKGLYLGSLFCTHVFLEGLFNTMLDPDLKSRGYLSFNLNHFDKKTKNSACVTPFPCTDSAVMVSFAASYRLFQEV